MINSNKNYLRNKYKEIRKNIYNKKIKSNKIYEKIINLNEFKKSKNIAIYFSMKDEVDTKKLIEKIIYNNDFVILPKTFENGKMEFYKITSTSYLINKKFGLETNIMEPNDNLPKVSKDEIDLMIIPGICFDRKKNRIGFGKGFYDRYLENNNIFKIGICYDEQLISDEYINVEKNDIEMDLVITDKNDL